MVRGGLLAAVIVTAAAASCEPSWTVHGLVVQPGSSPAQRAALSGATVTLRCDGPGGARAEPIEQSVETDEQGTFQLDGPGQGPRLDCEVLVAMNGFAPHAYKVDELCADADEGGERCATAALQAELAPLR
jgi:hypothetical protein